MVEEVWERLLEFNATTKGVEEGKWLLFVSKFVTLNAVWKDL